MKHVLEESLSEMLKTLSSWENDSSIKSIFILGTYKSELYKNFNEFNFNQITKSFCGGFYPMVFEGEVKSETGIVCIGLKQDFKIQMIKDLNSSTINLKNKIAGLDLKKNKYKTTFILIDAFTPRLEEVVTTISSEHGLDANYFGGGCGDLDFVQRPCVFTKDGLFENAVVFASSLGESTLGIKHGWDVVEGPFTITHSDKNIVYEINHQPAFLFYQNIIKDHSRHSIRHDNFFDVAKCFPFGLVKNDKGLIIRDPLKLGENNSIIFVGQLPQNSSVHIMKGTNESLIGSAKDAVVATGEINEDTKLIVMDCISRALFLNDKYTKEIKNLSSFGKTAIGALVLGEIANQGKDFLEFYNKTIVVCNLKNGHPTRT